jgi:hypothetical protein
MPVHLPGEPIHYFAKNTVNAATDIGRLRGGGPLLQSNIANSETHLCMNRPIAREQD